MSHALVVGVAEYELQGVSNLPECICDAAAIGDALQQECFFDASNIQILKGAVSLASFYSGLESLLSHNADTVVFYFSGHGHLSRNSEVDLVLSDQLLPASQIVELCRRSCQTSWLIFDICHAGAVSFNAEPFEYLEAKAGEGCVLFAACAPDMFSYINPDSHYSVFTELLVQAIHIARRNKGNISLSDIERALHCLVKNRNQHTNRYQQPLLLHSSAGPIMFHDPNYTPFQWKANRLPETELFEIKEIEPCFADCKRYSFKVLAKTHLTQELLIQELPKLITMLKECEAYDTESQQRRWEAKQTEVLFINFAENEEDYINSLFSYCAIWSIRHQDEKLGKGIWCDEAQCWIHEQWPSEALNEMRRFYKEGTVSDLTAIEQAKYALSKITTCASELFLAGDHWLGGLISTDVFSKVIERNQKPIEEGLEAALQIGYPSKKLRTLENQIIDLAGALRDLPLFFLGNGRIGRTEENLKQCFDITRRRYDNARIKIAEIIDSDAL